MDLPPRGSKGDFKPGEGYGRRKCAGVAESASRNGLAERPDVSVASLHRGRAQIPGRAGGRRHTRFRSGGFRLGGMGTGHRPRTGRRGHARAPAPTRARLPGQRSSSPSRRSSPVRFRAQLMTPGRTSPAGPPLVRRMNGPSGTRLETGTRLERPPDCWSRLLVIAPGHGVHALRWTQPAVETSRKRAVDSFIVKALVGIVLDG